jgi:ketosteroid isomerase-like protein
MKADAKTQSAVISVIDSMWKAYAKKDVDDVMSHYLPDPDLVVMGSGKDEVYYGSASCRKGLRRDFSQADGIKGRISKPRVSVCGRAAWLIAGCEFTATVGKEKVVMNGRVTSVLEKRRGKWLIAQWHFSMPYTGQAEGESWA